MIRCTPLPHRPDVPWCRVPSATFHGSEPCRACAREQLWTGRQRTTRDITKPVRWMTVADLYTDPNRRIPIAKVLP